MRSLEPLGAVRVGTAPVPAPEVRRHDAGRALPGARCPGCGRAIGKRQLKLALIELLLRNSRLTEQRRLDLVRSAFPEDSAPEAERARRGVATRQKRRRAAAGPGLCADVDKERRET